MQVSGWHILRVILIVQVVTLCWVSACAGQIHGPVPIHGRSQAVSHPSAIQSLIDRRLRVIGTDTAAFPIEPVPSDFVPWWQHDVTNGRLREVAPRFVELDGLILAALQYSPQVQAIYETELIRSTAIVEAEAEFDMEAFLESKLVRTNDPVGDVLTTGGPPRLRQSDWIGNGGVRRRTMTGGNLSVSQRFGYLDSNSNFLDPTQQGTARLAVNFTQPLLNGRGRAYNQSRIVLAQLDSRAARDDVTIELEEHLIQVTQAYWDLFFRRAICRQKLHHFHRARDILRRLEDRREIDAIQSQILSARAAVARRSADLNRAALSIRNAESRLRTLVAAPGLFAHGPDELLPSTTPATSWVSISMADAFVTALHYRADIDRALREVDKARVRQSMSSHELLPILNVVFEVYSAGLEGRSRIDQAWVNQFERGEPGFTAGFIWEMPLQNRAARARAERRDSELRQLVAELYATVDAVLLEVEIAVRELRASRLDIDANFGSMSASQAEVDYLFHRWTELPGDDRSASFLLEDLLKAQDRLADAESAFAQSQVAFALAEIRMRQVLGLLLNRAQHPFASADARFDAAAPPTSPQFHHSPVAGQPTNAVIRLPRSARD